ncbi:MAG TPA: leucyl aminopeptidase [Holophaga sp.]|nr:leucyl aminopeptidase [Holophaga sp.]HPS67261.1 leucyl aminopeptidase [Holophaga sp.]
MPKIDISSQSGKDFTGDALIVPVFSGRERHRLPLAISKVARQVMDESDFKAEYLEIVPLHHPNGVKGCRWMVLVGLGEEEAVTHNKIRKAVGSAARHCLKKGWKKIGVISPSTSLLDHDEVQAAAVEGALLADYDFSAYKGKPEPKRFEDLEVFTNGDDTRKARRRLPQIEAGVAGCHRVRDLANTPAGDLYPESFAEIAQKLAKQHKIGIEVLGPEELKEGGFNALLAVGQGSARTPRLVKMEYTPKEKPKKHVVLVGKGVCFDSGGLSLKDHSGMETMKDDMTGAAVVLAALVACAEAGAPVKVTGLMGLVENLPSGTSYKPGDVLRSRGGKTIEVLNCDAEGRLVLADLLDYASGMEADHIVDLATLTGACVVALGDGVSGILGTDQKLVERLLDAGAATGEHLWQLPLVEEYRESLKSQVADIKNTSGSRNGGAIVAALFLKDFVKHASWAHVDIAGGSWSSAERDYRPYGSSGEGPRWLLDWLMA